MNSDDYELICPQNPTGSVKISEFSLCHLAAVPSHAVITRPESRDHVVRVLNEQQVSDVIALCSFSVYVVWSGLSFIFTVF